MYELLLEALKELFGHYCNGGKPHSFINLIHSNIAYKIITYVYNHELYYIILY